MADFDSVVDSIGKQKIALDSEELPTSEIVVLEDSKDKDETPLFIPGLISVVKENYFRAKEARVTTEQNWLKAYQNYRGVYDEETLSKIPENNSQVFVKITKTKVLAAYSQLIEVIFAGNKFPIGIEPTKVPEGVSEYKTITSEKTEEEDLKKILNLYGFTGDGKNIPAGATLRDIQQLDILSQDKDDVELPNTQSFEGPALDFKKQIQLKPAEIAAKKMEKTILDQLEASSASTVLRRALFESAMIGTGIVKGPFNFRQPVNKWVTNENNEIIYEPTTKLIPKIEYVSDWNFYPDPDAIDMDNAEWVVQRHALNKSEFRSLKRRPYFREEALNTCLENGTEYVNEWWEDQLTDSQMTLTKHRFEVLEYWGIADRDMAEESGLELPDDFEDIGEVQVNIWICQDQILRLVLNPFTPNRIPYQVFPYEIHPYQFWGIGVAENMEDSQKIMNGHARMAIDNLKFAGNMVFDIDETSLVPGQDLSIFPGKIFRRQSGQPGAAVFGIKFPNTAPENLQMFDKFRQLSDEQTGIPSFSHGITGVMSPTRTASGMSMLMGAGALGVKSVVKNIDDYLLQPLGDAFFAWNMQFNPDTSIKGDMEIKARGTLSLIQKEVMSQRLTQFFQIASQPMIAPFIPWHRYLKKYAETLDLDPEEFVNDPDQAALFAIIMQKTGAMPIPEGGGQADQSGRGNATIGTAAPAQPGSSGFTGNPQQ